MLFRAIIAISGLLAALPAAADPGLGSLEGLWVFFLAAAVLTLISGVILVLVLRKAIRLSKSPEVGQRRIGWIIIGTIVLIAVLSAIPQVDFNLYLLHDNEYPQAVTIRQAYNERLMQTDRGESFFLIDQGLSYFKPGREVVLEEATPGQWRVFDIYESRSEVFHRLREAEEGKSLWIPIMPVRKGRYQLEDRGAVIRLGADWQVEDLGDHIRFVRWCCDAEWIQLLVARGADPNINYNHRLPLTQVTAAISYEPEATIRHMVGVLLTLGADPNARDEKGNTALHQATVNFHPPQIEMLLHYGVDRTLRNTEGQSAADRLQSAMRQHGRHWPAERQSQAQLMVARLAQP